MDCIPYAVRYLPVTYLFYTSILIFHIPWSPVLLSLHLKRSDLFQSLLADFRRETPSVGCARNCHIVTVGTPAPHILWRTLKRRCPLWILQSLAGSIPLLSLGTCSVVHSVVSPRPADSVSAQAPWLPECILTTVSSCTGKGAGGGGRWVLTMLALQTRKV